MTRLGWSVGGITTIVAGVLGAGVLAAACSDGGDADATVPVAPISVPASTDAPLSESTIEAGGNPPAAPAPAGSLPTGTGIATDAGFTLRADGLGDLPFGSAPDDVIVALSPTFPAPPEIDDLEFTVDVGGAFLTPDTSLGFTFPVGRRVCWPELCAYFGASGGGPLGLAGWSYRPEGDSFVALYTAAGITVGSRWDDHVEQIVAVPGGCRDLGFGTTTDGIDVGLRGGEWTRGDGASAPLEELVPDPAAVTVTVYRMQAGATVFPAEDTC